MKGTDRYRVNGVSCRLGERQLEVVNVSVGGLFVACGEPPLPGAALDLEMSLPGRRPLRASGIVTWLNEREAPRVRALPAGFGVKITRIGFSEKMALLSFLKDADPHLQRRR